MFRFELMLTNTPEKKQTGNKIGLDGTYRMGEVLKVNTTLTSLDLSCEQTNNNKSPKKKPRDHEPQTGNQICDDAADALRLQLRENKTLRRLDLSCEYL